MYLLELLNKKDISKPLGITSAVLIVYLSYRTISNIIDRKRFKNIPLAGTNYPIVGSAFSLTDMPGKKVYGWHQELNSPIIRLKMGAQNWIMISDPVLCQKILGENGKKTSGRTFSIYGYEIYGKGGNGVAFVGTNKSWREGRTACILSPKNVSKYYNFIQLESGKLVDNLIRESEGPGGVNPHKWLALNTVNIICHVSFGKNYESIDDPEYKRITHMVEMNIIYLGSISDIQSFFPFLSFIHKHFGIEKEMKNFIKNVRDPLMEKLIQEAKINKDVPNIIRVLEEDFGHISDDQKIVILNDVLNAGVDPIQIILRWSFALLCHFPEIQRDMAAEIDSFEKEHGRLPTFYDKENTSLVYSTILECIRVRPPTIFGIPHLTTEDVLVDDYYIPKDSLVMPSYDHMLNSPLYTKDGNKINFRRYIGEHRSLMSISRGDADNRNVYAFGWGRRVCPGTDLADAQLYSVFVNLFSKCTIEPTVGENGELIYPDCETGKNAGISAETLPYNVRFVKRAI